MRFSRLFAVWAMLLGVLAAAPPALFAAESRGSISGLVYFDANANGRPDSQERAVRNIQVDLEGDNNYRESRKTVDNGTYEFTNLAAGRYKITVRLPNGYGLSEGEETEIPIDGRTSLRDVNFGVARADQLATAPPRPTRTPIPGSSPAPSSAAPSSAAPAQPAPPFGSVSPPGLSGPTFAPPPPPTATRALPAAPPAPGQPAAAPSGSGQAAPGGAPAGSGGAPGRAAPGAPPPAATAEPTREPTREPTARPTQAPTQTVVPTPTRTPEALERHQAAAERAHAALASPLPPRTGSKRTGDNVLLDVPFRSALDGSHYADSNSGSAAVGMALEAYGFNVPTAELRALANVLGRSYDWDQPPTITYLARVAEQAGLRGLGLFFGTRPAVWTIDDVRTRVRAGYPVLTKIQPPDASGEGELGGERYVLIVGVQNNDLVYHDPAYPDTKGAQRTMTPATLTKAWGASAESGQAVAFSLGKAELGLFSPADDLARAQQAIERPTPVPAATSETVPTLEFPALEPRAVEPTAQPALPIEPGPTGGMPFHPLLLAFWATAGVVFFKVMAKLIFD